MLTQSTLSLKKLAAKKVAKSMFVHGVNIDKLRQQGYPPDIAELVLEELQLLRRNPPLSLQDAVEEIRRIIYNYKDVRQPARDILKIIDRVEIVPAATVWNEVLEKNRSDLGQITQIDRVRRAPTREDIQAYIEALKKNNSFVLATSLKSDKRATERVRQTGKNAVLTLQRARARARKETLLNVTCDGDIVQTDARTLFREFAKLVQNSHVPLDTLCGPGKMVTKITAWDSRSRNAKLCCAPSVPETVKDMYRRLGSIAATIMKMDSDVLFEASKWADECLRQLETQGTPTRPPRDLAVIAKQSVFALLLVVVLALVCLFTVPSAQKENTDVTVAQIKQAQHNSTNISPFQDEPYEIAYNISVASVQKLASTYFHRLAPTKSVPLLAPPAPRIVTPATMNVLYTLATAAPLVAQYRMF